MKKFIGFILIVLTIGTLVSCTTVESKNRGVKVSYGGKTDMEKVYEPGMHYGFNWLWDDMVEYNVSQQTIVEKFLFNDANNMETGVEIAIDFAINKKSPNLLHVNVTDWLVKLQKTAKSAAKEVIPQYSAVDLNLTKRTEAEAKLSRILEVELPAFYLDFIRVQITDVDIPKSVSDAAQRTAQQMEINRLSLAKVEEAENKFKEAEWTAKKNELLSQPAMLKLRELEIEMEYARKGVSRFGTNNVFGAGSTDLLLKR